MPKDSQGSTTTKTMKRTKSKGTTAKVVSVERAKALAKKTSGKTSKRRKSSSASANGQGSRDSEADEDFEVGDLVPTNEETVVVDLNEESKESKESEEERGDTSQTQKEVSPFVLAEALLRVWQEQDLWKKLANVAVSPEEKAEVPEGLGDSQFTLEEQCYKLFLGKVAPACPRNEKGLLKNEEEQLKKYARLRKQKERAGDKSVLSSRLPPSDYDSTKAVFGCSYELDQRTDPKKLQTAVAKLFDARHNKKPKNARLRVHGNWNSQPGFENRKVDWSEFRKLLQQWKAKSDFFEETWPFSGELGLEHVWNVLRPKDEVLEVS